MLSLTLIASLAAAVAGCGGAGGGKPDGSAAPSTGSGDNAGPKPTLRALQIWQKDDYNTYPVAKVLEEKTGYKVQYDMLPQDKPEDKLNLLIASGESYDAI